MTLALFDVDTLYSAVRMIFKEKAMNDDAVSVTCIRDIR